jgi:hypothetical protein
MRVVPGGGTNFSRLGTMSAARHKETETVEERNISVDRENGGSLAAFSLVAVIVVVALIALFVWQPWNSTTTSRTNGTTTTQSTTSGNSGTNGSTSGGTTP